MPRDLRRRDVRQNPLHERVAERADAFRGALPFRFGEFQRGRERDRAGEVLGAAAAAAFLPAPVQDGLERQSRADGQHADPLRRADLVPGERERVGAGAAQADPAAWTASRCSGTRAAVVTSARAATSCTVPISLFA
jgi:hypothetical protein